MYAFVQPQSGETYWWILPYVNTGLFSRVLKDFALHFGVGKDKQVVLPLDQAGWHMSESLEVPQGIHLVPLPPYSPELQPAERLWTLVNEPLANQAFETLDEVEELVARALPQVAIATAVDSRVNVLLLVAEDGKAA